MMWITHSLMSFGTVVLLASLFPFSLSSSQLLDSESEASKTLQVSRQPEPQYFLEKIPRSKRQLFREDIPHHRPLSGNTYALHHGFPHPGRFTDRPSRPVPVRPAGGDDDDHGNHIDSGGFGFPDGGFNEGFHGPPHHNLHTVDPSTVTITNDVVHDQGHHGGGYGHSSGPPPPPPPPHFHHNDEPPSYGVNNGGNGGGGYGNGGGNAGGYGNGGGNAGGYGNGGGNAGGYGNGGGNGGGYSNEANYGNGIGGVFGGGNGIAFGNGGGYGNGGGHGGGGYGGRGVDSGHNNNNHGGPHKTVIHYHPVQYGNFLPVGGVEESVTYGPGFGYGPPNSPIGPEVSTGFSGSYGGPPRENHHGGGGHGGGNGISSGSFTEFGGGPPHHQHHPKPHFPPGKEPLGVPVPIPILTHFHQSRPRRPKFGLGHHHGGHIKFPTYVVQGHKPRRRPPHHHPFRRPQKARWLINYGF